MFLPLVQQRWTLSLRSLRKRSHARLILLLGSPNQHLRGWQKFGDDPIAEVLLHHTPNKTDAEKEASAAVESPTKKHKVVIDKPEQQRKQTKRQRSRPKKMLRRQRRKPRRPGRKQRRKQQRQRSRLRRKERQNWQGRRRH